MKMRISEIIQRFLNENLRNLLLLASAISVLLGVALTVASFHRAEQEALFFSEGMKPYLLGLALSDNEDAIHLYIDEVNRKNSHYFIFDYENASVQSPKKDAKFTELTLAGQNYGRLLFAIKPLRVIPWLQLFALLVVILVFIFFARRLFRATGKFVEYQVVLPLERLAKVIEVADDLTKVLELEHTNVSVLEVNLIQSALSKAAFSIQDKEAQLRKAAVDQERVNLSQQLAHDIRSPLAALEMLPQMTADLPEDVRIIIRIAVGRIRDIANSLLSKGKNLTEHLNTSTLGTDNISEIKSVQLLSSVLDVLVTEKRMQYRFNLGVEIECIFDSVSYGLFAEIQLIEFKRVISNLVNNSVEAIRKNGWVRLQLSSIDQQEQIRICIEDNGSGIKPELIARLGQLGETHGKAGGTGLGLYHARTSVEKWGGKFEIDSKIGQGTKISITLPRSQSPIWFMPVLKIPVYEVDDLPSIIVILDDDSSIHHLWHGRFDSAFPSNFQGLVAPKLVHFFSSEELIAWHKKNSLLFKSVVYLCDYEFIGCNKNGLNTIEQLEIAGQSILVTSRFEESKIREHCEKLGVKLIPKGLAGHIKIEFERC